MSADRSNADRRAVACNYIDGTKAIPTGAKAYVILSNPGGGHDRLRLLVRSRGGRWIDKWENTRRLKNFRAVTLPPEHPRYGDERIWAYDADALADRLETARRLFPS